MMRCSGLRAIVAVVVVCCLIVGCGPVQKIDLKLSTDARVLTLSVQNNSDSVLRISDRFFELGTVDPPRIDFELSDESGSHIHQCSAVQYNSPPRALVVAPGASLRQQIDLAYLKGVFCATSGKTYFVRAVLVDELGAPDRRSKASDLLPVMFEDLSKSQPRKIGVPGS